MIFPLWKPCQKVLCLRTKSSPLITNCQRKHIIQEPPSGAATRCLAICTCRISCGPSFVIRSCLHQFTVLMSWIPLKRFHFFFPAFLALDDPKHARVEHVSVVAPSRWTCLTIFGVVWEFWVRFWQDAKCLIALSTFLWKEVSTGKQTLSPEWNSWGWQSTKNPTKTMSFHRPVGLSETEPNCCTFEVH